MESLRLLLNGFVIGLLASMPVGAIAIMSVQRTMNSGLWAGFSIGMGAAFADLLYASIAGFGLSIISDFLLANKLWLAIGGGIFLIFIGYKIYKSDTLKQYRTQKKPSKRTMANDFLSSFLLALSNPVTILGFTGFFATTGIFHNNVTYFQVSMLLTGVFGGATGWWLGISVVINHFKRKITLRKIAMINKITGVLIVIFGIALIIGMFILKKNS